MPRGRGGAVAALGPVDGGSAGARVSAPLGQKPRQPKVGHRVCSVRLLEWAEQHPGTGRQRGVHYKRGKGLSLAAVLLTLALQLGPLTVPGEEEIHTGQTQEPAAAAREDGSGLLGPNTQ